MKSARNTARPIALAAAVAIAVTASASCTPLTPNLDSQFGNALGTLKDAQTINRAASARTDNPAQDGKSAMEATSRYVKSFAAPTPHQSVLGTGTGSAR
ncbi:hypothetical protein [Noviherbaspirillum aerium]|uniref:hypothetical protein n=1 Tax=Noviherbaspirillum aerium TaxID=2588497 RepID=UPI00124E93F4|nr:hypothetical protein [Noviherbaspirillum aerium]